ncbi:unnamed protein product [Cylindrotheca closterium]|uniref:Calmodulin n=1 Tax=Cylindrotheca closterium TaxID=2856 RepID=A0AAD2FKZ4_9STRA|nr:unnamed protein product [Cylindrotheca closterium]
MPQFEDEPIIAAFKALDNAGSGKIDAEELKQLLTAMGEKYTDEEADKMIEDMGGGDSIDYAKMVKKLNAEANKDPFEGL